jgi:Phage P22-like portal protein
MKSEQYEDEGDEDVSEVVSMLEKAQSADADQREQARENEHFIYKADGMWEPSVVKMFSDAPRYTFDKTTTIIDSIAGEILQAEFAVKVIPGSGAASKENAELYTGLIRNIENISGFEDIVHATAYGMLVSGQDGWRVVTEYIDDDSFDQDLKIEKIANFNDRVWFDPASEKQDRSDAEWVIVLHQITHEEYERRFPDEDDQCASIGDAVTSQVYSHKPEDMVTIGEYIYKKRKKRELVEMSNGMVFDKGSDEYLSAADELAAAGVTEKRTRKRDDVVVCARFFDNDKWLSKSKETVFDYIPVIPVYGSFIISENKQVWVNGSKVSRLKDQQRVYNYVRSRQITEIALAPRAKWMVTPEQIEGFEGEFAKMNTSQAPFQRYNHEEGQPPPFRAGGAEMNPALDQAAAAMAQDIIETGGVFAANLGDNPNAQSGVAIKALQNKGDTGTVKYFRALEVAIAHTGRILIKAIKKVYDTERQIRILAEDGTSEIKTINQSVFDQQSGQMVTLNDLSQGQYDVVCSSGASFQNRQQETVQAIIEMGQYDPSIIQQGKDILLKNTNAPGMDVLSERARDQLFKQGMIPEAQLTDEERQQAQMAQQNQQPDPNMIASQAMMTDAQAKMVDAETKKSQADVNAQIQIAKLQNDKEKAQFDMMMEQLSKQAEVMQGLYSAQKTQAETLKLIREAMGVDAVMSQQGVQNYEQQNQEIAKADTIIDQSINQM